MPEFGLECARIGLRAGDEALLHRLVDDLDSAALPAIRLGCKAMSISQRHRGHGALGRRPMTVVAAARSTAETHDAVGFQVGQVRALEEAACAAAAPATRPSPAASPRDTGSDPGDGCGNNLRTPVFAAAPTRPAIDPSATRGSGHRQAGMP